MTAETDEPSDQQRLLHLVEIWRGAAGDAIALLKSLDEADWTRRTDLPGWDVRSVAAHLAHLESSLAGNPQEQVDVAEAPHIKGLMGQFTEAGTIARASWTTAEIIKELEQSVEQRYAALVADPPRDGSAPGPEWAALVGWSWETLLKNRPFDIWMHEQDIRRSTDRPGHLDSVAAGLVASLLDDSLPFVLAKKAGAPPGTTALLEVSGDQRRTVAAVVGDSGRGELMAEPPPSTSVTLRMDFETWVVLAGGRRGPADVTVEISGDRDLGERILSAMAVTP